MTSNLGSELIAGTRRRHRLRRRRRGDGRQEATLREQLMRPLREHFRPEFLNRIDEIIVFRRLERRAAAADHRRCCWRRPGGGCTRRTSRSSSPTAAVDWLAERGYQPEFGARPLRRTIQREVDNRLSRMLLERRSRPARRSPWTPATARLTFDVTAGERGYTAATTSHPR